MNALEQLIPLPRLLELDHAELAAPPARVWELIRHGDLARTPLIRALFTVRALPDRLAGRPAEPVMLHIDDLVSSPERPSFQVLADDAPREVAIGAIGKVWEPQIPFVHVAGAGAFAAFHEPGFAKVAWAVRVLPHGEHDSRVEVEVRVDTTDDASWREFRRYFRIIGIGSRFIRRAVLASLARELGVPEAQEPQRPLPGDELLPDAAARFDHGITIAATPEAIWPWLVQMGCQRAGYYSLDVLDNGGVRSARELHPELQELVIGQVLPATPEGDAGFEVLRVEAPRALVLGSLFDQETGKQQPFASERAKRFTQMTWAFVLEPLDARSTRLHVRVRAAFPAAERLLVAWIRPVHHLMETAQLRNLAARAEGRQPRDDWRDVREGMGGAARMVLGFLTPFARPGRNTWGLSEAEAARSFPGDALVPEPRWGWTHATEIDAPASEVWPWVAQVGAGRGGFYSYQWLENVVGCEVRNAETIHPEWQVREGDGLSLHPKMPPLKVTSVEPGRCFVAYAPADEAARAAGKSWMAATWLFLVEPLGDRRCRFISRFRVACSDDLGTRLALGPALLEPIGFAMDRRMLLGVKERAEHKRKT